MNNLIEPNIHPVLVHFAYALTVTGAIGMLVSSFAPKGGWRDTLKVAADWMLGLGAAAIILTIAAGFQAYFTVNHDAPSHAAMIVHRNWAVPTGAAILVLAIWRWTRRRDRPSALFSLLLLLAALSLSVTAWRGGQLVYGHGLGVSRMPMVTGEGHDHEHAPGQGHGDESEGEKHEDGHDHQGADDHEHGGDAADSKADVSPAATTVAAVDADDYPSTPQAVVDAYAAALRAKDGAAVLALLSPNVIIAEGGGAERSIDEYAGHHMPADMEFTAAVDFSLKKRDIIARDDLATVISESQIHGTFRDKSVHSRMMETMVLGREDGRWRIIHIHWSSAPITGEHEH